jgi:Mor family transcriptional regulator
VDRLPKRTKKPSDKIRRRNNNIIRRRAAGESVESLAEAFSLSETTIEKICWRAKEDQYETTAELHDAIRKAYREGEIQSTLAWRFRLSTGQVSHICRGVERRGPNHDRDEQIRRERAEGAKVAELAKKYGIGRSRISQISGKKRKPAVTSTILHK